MCKVLVNNEEQSAIIVEKWDISPSTILKHHESYHTTNKDLIGSHRLVIKEQSSVIWVQTQRRSRETNASGGCKVSGKG